LQRSVPVTVKEVPRTDLLVVVQAHSLGNNQPGERYGCANKAEVTRRCVQSLVTSVSRATRVLPGLDIRVKVFDDHSDAETLTALRRMADVESLTTHGLMPSIQRCYEYGREKGRQLVYFAQDDYLYCPTAIEEMVEQFWLASGNVGRWCAIYPFDDPYRYEAHNVVPVEIVLGKHRHWRRNYKTASCFMVHRATLGENWDLFDAMAHAPLGASMEDDTINRLFSERGVVLMTPIPSLALHFQFDTEKDPYIDWKVWWEAARV